MDYIVFPICSFVSRSRMDFKNTCYALLNAKDNKSTTYMSIDSHFSSRMFFPCIVVLYVTQFDIKYHLPGYVVTITMYPSTFMLWHPICLHITFLVGCIVWLEISDLQHDMGSGYSICLLSEYRISPFSCVEIENCVDWWVKHPIFICSYVKVKWQYRDVFSRIVWFLAWNVIFSSEISWF